MEHLAAWPVIIPLLAAAFLGSLSKFLSRVVTDLVAIGAAIAVTVASAILLHASSLGTVVYWFGGWRPQHGIAIGIAFAVDPIGAALGTLVALLSTTALVFAWRYFDSVGTLFQTLMLIFLAAMSGFCLSGDLFTLFVFFELMSVAAFALTAHKIESSGIEGALNFAISNSIGAFTMLWGIALLYGRTGALNFAQIARSLAAGPADGLVITAFALIATGLLIKAAVVPFHFWLADAHAVAPTPVCVLFSGVMVELGVYGVFRLYWTIFQPVFHPYEAGVRSLFLAIGAITAVLGAVMCFWQRHIKRLLAFSTISHVGMIVAGAGTLTARGLAGASLYVVGHGMVKASLFMCAGILLQCFGSLDEIALHGRGRKMKWVGLVVAIAGLGLAGFPPYGTYFGKALMEQSAEILGHGWVSWVFTFASAVTGAAVLQFGAAIFLGWGEKPKGEAASPTEAETRETNQGGKKLPLVMIAMAALLAILPAASAFLPHLAAAAQAAAERFIATSNYASAVLDGHSSGAIASTENVEMNTKGLLFGFGAAAAAIALALASLHRNRLPRRFARIFVVVPQKVMPRLRALHSGDIRDYVAWISIGIMGFAGVLFAVCR
jgi:multicomponent Na+:H+ antiporter subunit D